MSAALFATLLLSISPSQASSSAADDRTDMARHFAALRQAEIGILQCGRGSDARRKQSIEGFKPRIDAIRDRVRQAFGPSGAGVIRAKMSVSCETRRRYESEYEQAVENAEKRAAQLPVSTAPSEIAPTTQPTEK